MYGCAFCIPQISGKDYTLEEVPPMATQWACGRQMAMNEHPILLCNCTEAVHFDLTIIIALNPLSSVFYSIHAMNSLHSPGLTLWQVFRRIESFNILVTLPQRLCH
jgi:hypothetical protein